MYESLNEYILLLNYKKTLIKRIIKIFTISNSKSRSACVWTLSKAKPYPRRQWRSQSFLNKRGKLLTNIILCSFD